MVDVKTMKRSIHSTNFFIIGLHMSEIWVSKDH
jgi:hypothetical protein